MKKNQLTRQSGQVLLIAVMLIAVVLTVVFSAAFVSRTDTQISKLEEENQKALAAAEAGIEAVLSTGVALENFSTLNVPSGFTGRATISNVQSSSFITPLINRGGQYTFYLSRPGGTVENPNFANLTSAYNNQEITICSTSHQFALSLAFLKNIGGGAIKRIAVNPPSPNPVIISNGIAANNSIQGTCPEGVNFAYKHYLTPIEDVGNNNLILFVRLVGNAGGGAKLGFRGQSAFPLQGKTIVSEATSPTGISKTVQLFQSYPQIPAEFFVTGF